MDILLHRHLMVAMRDGVRLAADVYRLADRQPRPAALVRLPYGKDALLVHPTLPDLFRLVEAGYVVVVQDVRGTSRSEGDFMPVVPDAEDGVDTLEWICSQPWSDGSVGMYGGSYLGFTQWRAAQETPDALKVIVPVMTTSDFHRAPWYHVGGVHELALSIVWSLGMAAGLAARQSSTTASRQPDLAAAFLDPEPLLNHLPIRELSVKARAPWYADWLDHPTYDDFWKSIAPREMYEKMTIPALHITGWYDTFLNTTLDNYTGMRERAGSESARHGQRLLIGPWTHATYDGIYPARTFGPAAGIATQDITELHLDFFDRHLKDRPVDLGRPVKLFVMGVDEWREEDSWPLPGTLYVDYYLSSGGRANTAAGDGRLSTRATQTEAADRFTYDPLDPVPTTRGATLGIPPIPAGPADQRAVEARADVLCYTTEPLEQPVEVTGPVELIAFLSSSTLDTDVTGKLVDVFPDGRAINLTEGALRVRYRNSPTHAELMTPGDVFELRIDLGATANVFLPGHRIRLEVSSSNFPRFDRNTNTGGEIAADGPEDVIVAVNQIHHGPQLPSRLILPLINRDDGSRRQ